MKLKHLVLLILFITALQSCVIMSPKKHKALLAERDSLMARTNTLEEQVDKLMGDTSRIRQELAQLRSNYNALNNNYTASSSKVNQLSSELQAREARLKEVEEVLRKRDEATNALKEKLQKALLGFQQSGLSVDIRNGKVYVSLTDKLLFPSGSIVIDDKGKQALKQLAAVLNKEPDINIAVEGHTDNKRIVNLGQIKDNWDLSVLRATSVTRYLTGTENIDPKRLTATGKGEFQPLDTAGTPEALSRNRRIEIVLTPKLDELYNLITK